MTNVHTTPLEVNEHLLLKCFLTLHRLVRDNQLIEMLLLSILKQNRFYKHI